MIKDILILSISSMPIFDILTTFVSPSINVILIWLLARKKDRADVKTIELNNVEHSITIYRGMLDDLGARVDILSKVLREVQKENGELVNENKLLRKRVTQVDKEIKKLKGDL